MKKPFRKISVLIVLFSLFGIQNAASQGYVKLNALYALVGVVNPSVEFAISPKSTLQTDIVVSPWKSINRKHMTTSSGSGGCSTPSSDGHGWTATTTDTVSTAR